VVTDRVSIARAIESAPGTRTERDGPAAASPEVGPDDREHPAARSGRGVSETKSAATSVLLPKDDRKVGVPLKVRSPPRGAQRDLILPTLRELADVLIASGHEATAHEQEESSSTAGGVSSAAVLLRIVPKL
jgi:hypothetical protein